MKILSGVHQGMRSETGIKVSTLFGLSYMASIDASPLQVVNAPLILQGFFQWVLSGGDFLLVLPAAN